MKNSQKSQIKWENFPQPAVTFGMLTYQNMYINHTNNLWKFGEDTVL